MYIKTPLLDELFEKYDIYNLPHGRKEDKLGDLMEEYCTILLCSGELLDKAKYGELDSQNIDEIIFGMILEKTEIIIDEIKEIDATTNIVHRATGGNAKTDVLATFYLFNGTVFEFPISVKQTTKPKVAMAEFDAETIFNEVGIDDPEVRRLITKHQVDASATNFSKQEKRELSQRLKPHAQSLVRWVLTGTPVPCENPLFPKIIVKLKMSKSDEILDLNVYNIDEYIDSVMLNKKGKLRSGGFGTGLGWTYATGTKGKKIQFKG